MRSTVSRAELSVFFFPTGSRVAAGAGEGNQEHQASNVSRPLITEDFSEQYAALEQRSALFFIYAARLSRIVRANVSGQRRAEIACV